MCVGAPIGKVCKGEREVGRICGLCILLKGGRDTVPMPVEGTASQETRAKGGRRTQQKWYILSAKRKDHSDKKSGSNMRRKGINKIPDGFSSTQERMLAGISIGEQNNLGRE